jgi:hypothetical protein
LRRPSASPWRPSSPTATSRTRQRQRADTRPSRSRAKTRHASAET